jgi:hypothetical protein
VEPNTLVTLTTATTGATIYYTTNGVDPDPANLGDALAYEGPITIGRAVNLRMIAVQNGLNPSDVTAATYSVVAPEVVAEEENVYTRPLSGNRLFSYDRFTDVGAGPLFENVLRDDESYVVLSAMPEHMGGNELVVTPMNVPESLHNSANQGYSMGVASLYNVELRRDGMPILPTGQIEVGVPIPAEYADAMIWLCQVSEAGAITQLETRRSGGVAYALTDTTGNFAIGYSLAGERMGAGMPTWAKASIAGGIVALLLLAVGLVLRWRAHHSSERDRTRIPYGMPAQGMNLRPGQMYPDLPPADSGGGPQGSG